MAKCAHDVHRDDVGRLTELERLYDFRCRARCRFERASLTLPNDDNFSVRRRTMQSAGNDFLSQGIQPTPVDERALDAGLQEVLSELAHAQLSWEIYFIYQ